MRPPRKLSVVLQLSDPSEYEGGDLEIMNCSEPTQVKKEKGLVTAFPSFMLHRVTPVTKGIRRTLVVWLTGPRFR
jgi:PKHD-type hydroxylase